ALTTSRRGDVPFPSPFSQRALVCRLQRRVHARRQTLLLSADCQRFCQPLSSGLRRPFAPTTACLSQAPMRSSSCPDCRCGGCGSPSAYLVLHAVCHALNLLDCNLRNFAAKMLKARCGNRFPKLYVEGSIPFARSKV